MKELAQIILDAKAGKQDAFTNLYNRYHKLIRYVVWNIVKNDDVADDLTLVTFTKAFQKIDTFVNNISFEMWLKTIAFNTSIDYIRRVKEENLNRYIDNENEFIQIESNTLNPEERIIKSEDLIALGDAMLLLRSRYRKLIELRYHQDLSYKEIAAELGIPEGTVKSDLNKAKKKLKEFFKN